MQTMATAWQAISAGQTLACAFLDGRKGNGAWQTRIAPSV